MSHSSESVGAAATGLTDWQHTHEQSRRIGLVHGALNAIATGLYAASWWDRRRGRHRRGMASSALGYGLSLGGGYLGGCLVFGAGTGVDRSGARLRGDRWMPVLPATALDRRPHRVAVNGVGVVLYRTDGQVIAVGEHCPHLGAHLGHGGTVRGEDIVCPFHAWRYDGESGRNVEIPYAARDCFPGVALRRYEVHEQAGVVYFWHDANRMGPAWDPPRPIEDPDQFFPVHPEGVRTWTLKLFPQFIPENGGGAGIRFRERKG